MSLVNFGQKPQLHTRPLADEPGLSVEQLTGKAGTRRGGARFGGETDSGNFTMTDQKTARKKQLRPPAPTLSGAPDRAFEIKLKKHPEDEDAKVDLGSDESMDASDPISTTQPGSSEPAPSSGYPKKKSGD